MVEDIKKTNEEGKSEKNNNSDSASNNSGSAKTSSADSKSSSKSGIKRKDRKNVAVGVVHVSATFNNTMITITDLHGNVVSWSSAGAHGFKGSKKSTPFAAQVTAEHASKIAKDHGMKTVSVKVKGPGTGRESALRALQAVGFQVTTIQDVTSVPHNGCRPKKRRRV